MRHPQWLVLTSALAVPLLMAQFQARIRLVEVYATVFDRQGHAVDDLGKERFIILDNDTPRDIVSFEPSSDNYSVAILIDTTGSMRDTLAGIKNSVSSLLDQMRAGDSAAVFGFNTSLVTLQDFTMDKSAAKRAVLRTRASGQTALFDAIAGVSVEISKRQGKKAIVLFTDGADNASNLNADSAANRALKTGVPVFAVAEGSAVHEGALLKQLRVVAEKTGGRCYSARTSHDVARVFADIHEELKHVYLLTFKPSEGEDAKWHTIQLSVAGAKDYKIRGRQGYFPD